MIITCPACATRYQADEAKFPAEGRQVRCAKCGHLWHQPGPQPEAAPLPQTPAEEPASAGAPEPESDAASGYQPASGDEPMRPNRASPPLRTATPDRPRPALLPLIGVALGWIGLIAVVLLIGLSAVRYRQEITVIWPQSAGVYDRLGMKVNMRGIDFVHVDYHRESEDGQVVLAVTGQIVNNGPRELPVPQNVRVTISDNAKHELYHWELQPGTRSLRPGQSIPFTTHLSSPPASARRLEVRFAPPDKK